MFLSLSNELEFTLTQFYIYILGIYTYNHTVRIDPKEMKLHSLSYNVGGLLKKS